MSDFDYLVVGGGVAGLGAFLEIVRGELGSICLLEGRNDLMYTLTWMKSFPFGEGKTSSRYTGIDFRKKLLFEIENITRDDAKVLTGVRVFKIDRESKVVYARSANGAGLQFEYKKLIVAVGATQIVYGRYLLPGVRGGRIFSAYQVGEMLEHYPFLPGKKLIVFGESEYAIEVALSAYEKGIGVSIVSPSNDIEEVIGAVPGKWPEAISLYTGCVLKQVLGDTLFRGLVLQRAGAEFCVGGDSLAVDGDFVLEHPWREHLGVEWNLDRWQLDMNTDKMRELGMLFVGDAQRPSPNFVLQYHEAKRIVRECLGSKGN